MSMTRIASVAIAMVGLLSAAAVADEAADYETRLQEGREAAYRKHLLTPEYEAKRQGEDTYAGGSASAGYGAASFRVSGTIATPSFRVSAGNGGASISLRSHPYGPVVTPTRFNYNFNYRVRPSQPSDAALIYHPNYDPRYRRSWPRPVQTRTWVPSHYTWDGSRYRYVPGQAVYQTRWVTVGRERWHFNGSHYSVTKSFR